jgi:hypothetical protein
LVWLMLGSLLVGPVIAASVISANHIDRPGERPLKHNDW